MRSALRERNCLYGEREIVKVLRPKFLGTGEYLYLDYVSGTLMGLFDRLADRILADPELQLFMNLSDGERRLIAPQPLVPRPCAFARLDSFLTRDGFRFAELNGECPAGPGFVDASLGVFLEQDIIKELRTQVSLQPVEALEGLLGGLLMAWRVAGKRGSPRILITDYLDLPTAPEFYMIRDFLRSRGLHAEVEDPRNLTYREGRLMTGEGPVDLVYRRVLTNEFLEREDEVRPLFEAYRDQAIVMVNPFRSKLAHKKAAFALLTGDAIGTEWMTAEEQEVVRRHIPWTRKARECRTWRDGREIDLMPFALENRDRLVLKPSDEYGGRGIVIGWEIGAPEWEAALQAALHGDFVLQDRIYTAEEPYPVFAADLEEAPMIVDLDPYIYFGRVHGVLARLAAGALCNVTSGGGQVPVLLYPDL